MKSVICITGILGLLVLLSTLSVNLAVVVPSRYAQPCLYNFSSRCVCTRELFPVCGSNGRTYGNFCTFRCEQICSPGLTLAHKRACSVKRKSHKSGGGSSTISFTKA